MALQKNSLSTEIAEIISLAVIPEGLLAAGLSASPMISNLVFEETDIALKKKSEELSLSYSRYANDLAFSGAITDVTYAELVNVIKNLVEHQREKNSIYEART